MTIDLNEVGSFYDFEYNLRENNTDLNADNEFSYFNEIAKATYNYYCNCQYDATLQERSRAALRLHDAFSDLCKYLKFNASEIEALERKIF